MTLLTFIIPVRHQDNARDWPLLKRNLDQTVRSIANQSDDDWRGVIVANRGADLPRLPDRFQVEWVDFPPNRLHEQEGVSQDQFLDAFRLDKGRRVLAGVLSRPESEYFMIVDDDDLVSRSIVQFVRAHRGGPGWKIDKGFIWDSDGPLLLKTDSLNSYCGTTLVIRADLYRLWGRLEDLDEAGVKATFGSHKEIVKRLLDKGAQLAPLPFRGAVYRVANPGSHSRTPGIFRQYIFGAGWMRRPLRTARRLLSLRLVARRARLEFFGAPAAA
jgi:hypothetical protein